MKKTTLMILFILCLVIVACSETKTPAPTVTPQPIDSILVCEDNGRIILGDYVLNNNPWNKGGRTDYTQCIFAQSDTYPTTFGWRWDWPGTGREIKSYPEVMLGDSPWDSAPPTGQLPLPVSESDILVTYDASLEATGNWNVALEMWLTSEPVPTEDNITDEVMIWVASEGITPGPPAHSIPVIDEVKYSLHVARGHGDASGGSSAQWSYMAFYARQPQLSGTLDMRKFLDYLLENDLIEEGRYVASLELGTELAAGSGEFILSTYEVTFP